MGVTNSSVRKKAGAVESPMLYFLSLSHSHERTSIKGTIMQVNVIHALRPEK